MAAYVDYPIGLIGGSETQRYTDIGVRARLMRAVQSAPYVTAELGAFQIWFSEAHQADVRNQMRESRT